MKRFQGNTKRSALLVALIAVTLGLAGCPKDKYTKAATFSKDFASTVLAAQQVEMVLHQQGKISDAEHKDLQEYFLQVALAGQQLDDAIVKWHSGEKTAGALVDALNKIETLQAEGVLHIRNPESQAQLRLAIESAKVILANIQALAQ